MTDSVWAGHYEEVARDWLCAVRAGDAERVERLEDYISVLELAAQRLQG